MLLYRCYEWVRANFDIKHGELRPRSASGNGNTARGVLQFTHTLERSATPRRAVRAGGVRGQARARIVAGAEVFAVAGYGGGHRIRWGLADHPWPHCAP